MLLHNDWMSCWNCSKRQSITSGATLQHKRTHSVIAPAGKEQEREEKKMGEQRQENYREENRKTGDKNRINTQE